MPLDIAQQLVRHCTGKEAALTEEGLADSSHSLHLLPAEACKPGHSRSFSAGHSNPFQPQSKSIKSGHSQASSVSQWTTALAEQGQAGSGSASTPQHGQSHSPQAGHSRASQSADAKDPAAVLHMHSNPLCDMGPGNSLRPAESASVGANSRHGLAMRVSRLSSVTPQQLQDLGHGASGGEPRLRGKFEAVHNGPVGVLFAPCML